MNVLSLFDGLSGGRIALDRLGIQVDNYYSSEIDKYAIQVSQDNYPDIIRLGSVLDLSDEDLKALPKIDLLIGGSPCQGFSLAGHQKGSSTKEGVDVVSLEQYLDLKEQGFEFNGQSYLFWEYVRIWQIIKPKYFFLENVKITAKWLPMFNDTMGCEPIKINSNLMSAQNRLRFYWTNIPNIEQPTDKKLLLESILEDKIEDRFLLVEELSEVAKYTSETYYNCAFTERRTEEAKRIRREHRIKHGGDFSPRRGKELVPRTDSKMNCLTATFSKKEHSLLDSNGVYRKLTPLEFERLQTLPENYTQSVSDNQRYRMIGNGWTIDVICHFFKNMEGV